MTFANPKHYHCLPNRREIRLTVSQSPGGPAPQDYRRLPSLSNQMIDQSMLPSVRFWSLVERTAHETRSLVRPRNGGQLPGGSLGGVFS